MEEGDVVVLSDEVQNFAQWIRFGDTANLLGLAMAHEMGHVLLRTLGHSGEGIMQARWRPKDLRDSEHGLLLFTPEQGQLMRNEVARRVLGRLGAQAPQPSRKSILQAVIVDLCALDRSCKTGN